MVYNTFMLTILKTEVFSDWFHAQDKAVKARIDARLVRLELGHLGDAKAIGDGVSELRFHVRSGIRVYFMQEGQEIIILLAGGDKDSQQKDIKTAKKLARMVKEE